MLSIELKEAKGLPVQQMTQLSQHLKGGYL